MGQRSRSTNRPGKPVVEVEGNPVRNELLLGLPADEYDAIFSRLTFVSMRTHEVLQESEETIKYAYFPDSGLASILNLGEEGKSVEVGITGRDGCTALPLAVGLKSSISRIVVQIAGGAFRVPSEGLLAMLRECPQLQNRMQQYSHVMGLQSAQIAACNRLHDVDERLARWLLMCQDRIDSDVVPLTQEFVAHMLGTRRSSVTVAAGLLQKAGLISYSRGELRIEERSRLEDASCECYELIRRHTALWKKESLQ